MKALMLKDLLNMRKYLKTLAIFLVGYLGIAWVTNMPAFVTSLGVVFCMMVSLLIFTYDEQSKWDAYGLSLPVTRTQVVQAKYLFALLVVLMGCGITALCSVALLLAGCDMAWQELGFISLGTGYASLLLVGIMLPCIYKVGVEKARFLLLALVLVPAGLIYMLMRLGVPLPDFSKISPATLLVAAIALLLLLWVVSYQISCRIYAKREI